MGTYPLYFKSCLNVSICLKIRQRLKTELDAVQAELIKSRKIWRERNDKLAKENRELLQENEQVKKVNKQQKLEISQLSGENINLKIENKALFSAIERFLEFSLGETPYYR